MKEVVMIGEIRFRRAVRPAASEGNPEMSGYKSILMAAKARLSTYISSPRNELYGLLIVKI